ncbi:MAG: penicillin-binding protein 1C [Dysgonamonadaceae bacterium]|jgi:penicillin-binding protein 1C|nr:penicillin-binding protein 1C [Dysgonamonadaceae bacterium]
MNNKKDNDSLKIRNKRLVWVITGIILLIAYIFCLPKTLFDAPCSTVVTDRNGELLGARIADDKQWRFPACDTVPEKFKICITAFEDRYFRWHWGVNPWSIGRALVRNVKAGKVVNGGSTITMQVIRLSRNRKRTVWEKSVETILATRLEFRYSKGKILALYASHAPFGGNVVGLNAASWRYFGHSANELSWAEASTLAVLPNAPAMLHLSKNRDLLLKKRNRLLQYLFQKGTIDATTYDLAKSEDLPGEPLPLPQIAPHLITYFYKNQKGEQIQSTIDKNLQIRVEAVLEQWNADFLQQDIRNLAAIVLDVQTNRVLAYCGNVQFNEKTSGNQVDVIRADRSTGSILKPFLYYAALQDGEILPHTLLPDIPLNVNGFTPQNFNRQYEGAVPANEAVARSLNVPLVNLLRQYSVPKFYDFLKQYKIAALPRQSSHYGLSLILGGAEAQLGDVTNVYSNMARALMGLKSSQYSVSLSEKGKQVPDFQPAAVWQVFDAIKEVNRPEEIDWKQIPTMQKIAWKTGTSYGFRDAWAVGVTPKYAVGVWVGNSNGEGKPNLVGARTAGPVLFDIFNLLPSSTWFRQPVGGLVEAEICRQSGCLKNRFCEETDTVLICRKGLQTETCPYHIQIHITADEQFRVYENCIEAEAVTPKTVFVLPPAWAWYYKQHHPDYQSLPPFKQGCGNDASQAMQFIYPQGNAVVHLTKQLDGSEGKITFQIAHNRRNATIFWHIDSEYMTATTDFHKLSVHLVVGRHFVIATDDEGNTISCSVTVE